MNLSQVYRISLILIFSCCCLAQGKQPRQSGAITDRFDLVEVNHHYNKYSYYLWTQLIFYDYDKSVNRFHCQAWKMMKKDHLEKTLAGAEIHERHRRAIESLYKDLETRKDFLNNSNYKGDFVGGPEYPVKDFKRNVYITTIYGVGFNTSSNVRRIETKFFRVTHTQYDPERKDRDFLPEDRRRGFSNQAPEPESDPEPWEWTMDFIGPRLHKLR